MTNKSNKNDIFFIGITIIIITLLHYFTISTKWEIHDFYRRLYYIPIIVSAFKFRLKGGVLSSLVISIFYAPHLFLYFRKFDIAILNQFLEIIMFVVIGIITGFLAESDFKRKKMLQIQIKKLTDLENFTQNILDSITNGLIAVDKNLKIKSINKDGREIFNLDEYFIEKEIDTLFADYEKLEGMLIEVIEGNKKMLNIETRCNSKNNKYLDVKLLAYPLKNITGKIDGLVLVIEDISEIKKLESQVRRADKLSAVGELASGVAHEIRNPLGIIKTISQTIKEDIKDNNIEEEEINEGLDIIIHEIDRANSVIKGLLDFAKPSVYQIKTQSINKLIKNIVLITNKYAQQHNVEINYTFEEDKNILIDGEKLKQAFINIIFNCIHAMPKGGKLNINLSKENSWVKISFEDEGIGIPRDKLEKIFEPFYTTKDTGTGLGLSITHRIIEEHNGYIKVESEIGIGTKLHIYLPDKSEKGE
ncbi:two-component system sensor histidine kinase NtrB [Tepidibacter formicigenes]|jgi:PAS domain S-box-containing protein|uniref:histidine kinase n=1 Tax=Tepidibacter formicigenes DSM 15518 TaxID=1123349 RepID=A0A1M6LKU5_9FIRM|nr:ATP-binding protein [Tepidibacter formicigenes]SHJ71831.1 PAS domain S-box-containing protein [Tepidibacter formicigenes DSM 15518]